MRSPAGVPGVETLAILVGKYQCDVDEPLEEISRYKVSLVRELLSEYAKPTAHLC